MDDRALPFINDSDNQSKESYKKQNCAIMQFPIVCIMTQGLQKEMQ